MFVSTNSGVPQPGCRGYVFTNLSLDDQCRDDECMMPTLSDAAPLTGIAVSGAGFMKPILYSLFNNKTSSGSEHSHYPGFIAAGITNSFCKTCFQGSQLLPLGFSILQIWMVRNNLHSEHYGDNRVYDSFPVSTEYISLWKNCGWTTAC